MADSIKIVFDAVDNTQKGINAVQNGVKKVASALTAVIATATAVGVAMKKASDSFTNYADQVSAVQRVTGATAEESSKLIQVADDLFISYESLSMAMKAAVKNGIEPNIETLASLSDQYLALAPGVERSSFALEKFGKNGLEMAKFLEQGGDKIREMADSVPDGLILSEENIAMSVELKTAWDNLSDAASAFGLGVMTEASPALTGFLGLLEDFINAEARGAKAWGGIFERLDAQRLKIDQFGMLRPNKQDFTFETDATAKTNIQMVIGKVDTGPAEVAVDEAMTKQKFDFVLDFQAKSDDFEKTRDELLAKMRDTRDKILAIREEMAAGTTRQSEGNDQIAELTSEMDGYSDAINQNAADWKAWQKQTAFSLMSAQAMAKGASFEDIMKMGEDFGVIDPEVVAQATAMMDAVTNVDPGNLESAVANVRELIAADGRTIKIYVEQTVTDVPSGGTMPTTGMASTSSGGDTFINYGPQYFYGTTLSGILAEWR